MSNLTKLLAGITALITAVGGMIVALQGGGEPMPQPITQIIIQDIGDYQQFIDQTDLDQYQQFKS
jgi:hypothetical protein